MEPKEAIVKLECSAVFKDWKKQNKKSYLANFFAMIENQDNNTEWHVGYYNPEKDRIVSFIVGEEITKTPESEVFKEKDRVLKLDMSKIKIDFKQAIINALNFQEQKYPGNTPLKKIILLQNYDSHYIYNITFVTQTFKTLNIKVSSQDGRIISDKIHSIFDFNDKSYDKK
jgi:hypothetical protein